MTTFEITKKQNIRVDGVKYVAKNYLGSENGMGCMQCVLKTRPECTSAPCNVGGRTDGRNVIFVAKKKKVAA